MKSRKAKTPSEKFYLVKWEIDIEAKSPKGAAQKALEIQRNPESIATLFKISWEERMHNGKTIRKAVVVDTLE